MRKHGGPPSRLGMLLTLAASPPGIVRGRFAGGQQSRLAGCKPPSLFKRRDSSCTVTEAIAQGTMGRIYTTECTYRGW